jgi:hypothetical protein
MALIERLWGDVAPHSLDRYGEADPRVYALGEQASLTRGPATQAAVVTALIRRPENFAGSGPLRVVVVTHWRMVAGEWRLVFLLGAFVLGEDFLQDTEAGRAWLRAWERFQP